MSANEIIPNLWLGDHVAAQSSEFFNRMNIQLIVNCSKDIPFSEDLPKGCKKIRIPVHDNLKEEEINHLSEWSFKIITNIWDEYKQGKPVFIHCYAGVQRSAAVVAMFLIFYFRCSVDEAVKKIRQRRPIAFQPKINFLKSIYFFERGINDELKRSFN